MKKLLIITILLLSISLFAEKRTMQKGEIRLTASVGYKELIPDKGDNSRVINIMGQGLDMSLLGASSGLRFGNYGWNQFIFLDKEASGLAVFYALNENMQVALSRPVFSYFKASGSLNQTSGPVKLGFLYILPMGLFDITINPYISIPFTQKYGGDLDVNFNFDQPFGAGVSLAAEGSMDKLHWGGYLGLSKYFEREKEGIKYGKFMFMSLSAMIGYEVSEGTIVRLNIIYDLNEFQHKGDDDFSSLFIKAGMDIALTKSIDLSVSLLFQKPIDSEDVLGIDFYGIGATAGLSMKF